MVKQERATRTRLALVRAAAREIDRRGYEGTTLARVCDAADASKGALTFHFPTKYDLAHEIQMQGAALTRLAAEQALALPCSPLGAVGDLVVEIARLLEEDVVVRSAARLARELPDSVCWTATWLPGAVALLGQARDSGRLRPSAQPGAVAALLVSLLTGIETTVRERARGPVASPESAAVMARRFWELLRAGIATENC